ncbi:MAG: hypothetical protein OHK93_006986 [Ramalina farinacea]|uniref:Uncharacterized protein n=1 Tax=Ramalina farinacea TaxID=258253 RepID=A0AA43QNX0_9LECA|nr:hypothetical protein [Ramalina farinacea]
MAALILGAGALAYDQVQKSRAKRRARKDFNDQRFSELERENADRINGGVKRGEGEEERVGGARPTAGAPETEVERLRINEERRRKDRGYKRLFGRKKAGQEVVGA